MSEGGSEGGREGGRQTYEEPSLFCSCDCFGDDPDIFAYPWCHLFLLSSLPPSFRPPSLETAFKAPILEKYNRESSCYYSSARLWDDGVIRPQDTRQVLGLGLAVAVKEQMEQTRFGVFRM